MTKHSVEEFPDTWILWLALAGVRGLSMDKPGVTSQNNVFIAARRTAAECSRTAWLDSKLSSRAEKNAAGHILKVRKRCRAGQRRLRLEVVSLLFRI